jgi:hypothetical protein
MDFSKYLDWIKLSPRYLLPIALFTGFALFAPGEPVTAGSSAPEGAPDVGRIVEIAQKYGLEIPPPPPPPGQ